MGYRIIYALSNAGANPNITDEKGNTPLHTALIQGCDNVELDLVQVQRFHSKLCDTYMFNF